MARYCTSIFPSRRRGEILHKSDRFIYMYTSQQYTSQHKTNRVKWHGRWQEANHVYRQSGETSSLVSWPKCTQATSARFQHPGSGNLLTYSWQPSHCTIIIHGCYVHKPWSITHSVMPWWHAVRECNTGKHCTSCQLENIIGWKRTTLQSVPYGLFSTEPKGNSPEGEGYMSYSTWEVATDDVSVNVCPSTSRRQTLLVRLYAPKTVL